MIKDYIDNITVNRYNDIRGDKMFINDLLIQKNISKYRLSKSSGIPYTTINDICSGKAKLQKCSAETIYKISKVLDISMEDLLSPCFETRIAFELFKSNVCHRLKEIGDINFIIESLEHDEIRMYYNKKYYAESFYLLAMLDFISRENNVPLCNKYDDLRNQKLENTIYPSSIQAIALVNDDQEMKQKALNSAIPEFIRFNIVENEVRNVI